MKTLIVGTGMTALTLADKLAQHKGRHLVLVEKSKGVGGRLATRRTADHKFDHGAQFYNLSYPMEIFHRRWQDEGLICVFDAVNPKNSYSSVAGMTALAKALAKHFDVRLECKVEGLRNCGKNWLVKFQHHDEDIFDEIILTAPLPQALELLDASKIDYESHLRSASYDKAIVGLIELKNTPLHSKFLYLDNCQNEILTVTNQHEKGVSPKPAWTVVMNAKFSEKFFDETDETLDSEIRKRLNLEFGELPISQLFIKKWRYCVPRKATKSQFAIVSQTPLLALAGDGFTGASIKAAVQSASALAEWMILQKEQFS